MTTNRFLVLDCGFTECGTFATEKQAVNSALDSAKADAGYGDDTYVYYVAEIIGSVGQKKTPPPVTYKNLRTTK